MSTAGIDLLISRGAMGVIFAPRVGPGQRRVWEARVNAGRAPAVMLGGNASSVVFRMSQPPAQQTFNPRSPSLAPHQLDYYRNNCV